MSRSFTNDDNTLQGTYARAEKKDPEENDFQLEMTMASNSDMSVSRPVTCNQPRILKVLKSGYGVYTKKREKINQKKVEVITLRYSLA
jgi:hypothetical protein